MIFFCHFSINFQNLAHKLDESSSSFLFSLVTLPSCSFCNAAEKTIHAGFKESDIETVTPRVCQVPIPGLPLSRSLSFSAACLASLHGCLCALSAVQPGRDMHPPCPCARLQASRCADVHTIYCPHQIGSLLWCFVQASHLLFSTFSHKRLNSPRLEGKEERGGGGGS